MAIASLVCGIVGFLLTFIPCFGWIAGGILAILGIVFGGVGISQANKLPDKAGKGMAIAGLIMSILAIVWIPLYILVIAATSTVTVNGNVLQP